MRTHLSGAAETFTLLILVPHRDARLPLLSYSRSLFASGLNGAWSFPWAAPLALLSRPFSAEELKQSARALRETLAEKETFRTGAAAFAPFPPDCSFNSVNENESGIPAVFGPMLAPEIPDSIFPPGAAGKIQDRFLPPVLGAAFTRVAETAPEQTAIQPPPLSFRAAALANMRYRISARENSSGQGRSCLFTWKIGTLRWLPRAVKKS